MQNFAVGLHSVPQDRQSLLESMEFVSVGSDGECGSRIGPAFIVVGRTGTPIGAFVPHARQNFCDGFNGEWQLKHERAVMGNGVLEDCVASLSLSAFGLGWRRLEAPQLGQNF